MSELFSVDFPHLNILRLKKKNFHRICIIIPINEYFNNNNNNKGIEIKIFIKNHKFNILKVLKDVFLIYIFYSLYRH